jgi:hypothetical protein
LDYLANKLDSSREKYADMCFLVYKILFAIQKDVAKNSPYWEFLKIPNNDDYWDPILNTEEHLLDQLGQMIKEIVVANGASLSMRM